MPRFLVIDDDNTTRELIVATLEHAGHVVDQAATGNEAIALFHQHPADVIITDIVMPSDSLVQVIALRNEFPAVPFIVTSGLVANSPQTREIELFLGARRMLPKPFKLADLLGAVDAVLAEQTGRVPPAR